MVRLTGPMDVPYAPVGVTRRVIAPFVDNTGTQIAEVGRATTEVLQHVREQQIDNQVADAEANTRRQLDELRLQMENEPAQEASKDGSPPLSYEDRWQQRADAILEENSARLTAPMAREAWTDRTRNILTAERGQILQLGQRRMLEEARAGLLTALAKDQTLLSDEDATPEARTGAMERIETMVRRAVDRRMIGADDGARMIILAHDAVSEFERTIGVRTTVQSHVSRYWEASGGNFDVAREMAREELSGTMEDDVVVGLRQERVDQSEGRSQTIESAMGRSYAALERGVPLEALPSGDLSIITEAGMRDTLRVYQSNMSAGAGGMAEATRASAFIADDFIAFSRSDAGAVMLADPDVDVNTPLPDDVAAALHVAPGTTLGAILVPDDVGRIRQRQAYLRGEAGADGGATTLIDEAFRRVWAVIEPRARARDSYLAGDANARRQRAASLTVWTQRAVEEFVREHNRAPRPGPELEAIVSQGLMRGSVNATRVGPVDLWSGGERSAFELESGQRFTPNYNDIPIDIRNQIDRALQARHPGTPVYEHEVENEYDAFLRARQQ